MASAHGIHSYSRNRLASRMPLPSGSTSTSHARHGRRRTEQPPGEGCGEQPQRLRPGEQEPDHDRAGEARDDAAPAVSRQDRPTARMRHRPDEQQPQDVRARPLQAESAAGAGVAQVAPGLDRPGRALRGLPGSGRRQLGSYAIRFASGVRGVFFMVVYAILGFGFIMALPAVSSVSPP